MDNKTATQIDNAARTLLAQHSVLEIIEIYLHAFDTVPKGDSALHMAAAQVRGWCEEELQRRSALHELAEALNVCELCWTPDRSHGAICTDCWTHYENGGE